MLKVAMRAGGGSQPYHRGGSSSSSKCQDLGNEDFYNARFCASVGGRTETRHNYNYPSGSSYVKVDCETTTHVYEGGLGKRSGLDSVQQALFFSSLTGKKTRGRDLGYRWKNRAV